MEAETASNWGILISSGSVGAICGVVSMWLKAKIGQKSTVTPDPSPFPVQQQGPFVTVGECKQHRCAIQQQIDRSIDFQKKLLERLDVMDSKAEKRSCDLHRRLDPVVETVAANKAKIEVFEALAKSSTLGGKK